MSLAQLIVSGEIFSFEWHDTFWIPMFQFEPESLGLNPGPRQVLAELSADFDGWSLAVWFAHPNSWLNERRPVDLLGTDLASVLRAARVDRYIAAGRRGRIPGRPLRLGAHPSYADLGTA